MSREVLSRGNEPRRVLPRNGGGTIVGVSWSESAWIERFKQVDADIFAQDGAVDAELAAIKARTPVGQMPSAEDQKPLAWMPNWYQFKFDWTAFKANEPNAYDDNELALYDFQIRLRQLTDKWKTFGTAVQTAVPISPTPEKPKGFLEGAGDGLESLSGMVRWVVIGGVAYVVYRAFSDVRSDRKEARSAPPPPTSTEAATE
jgi:hypothetical protein